VAAVKAIGSAQADGERDLFDPALGKAVTGPVIDRESLTSGQTIAGPAVIVEDETTIILPSSRKGISTADGCIDINIAK